MIYGGKDVEIVKTFRVFNRWGEILMEHNDFTPNDPSFSWDGRLRNKELNEGVFIFYAEVEFIDGKVILYEGNVNLIR